MAFRRVPLWDWLAAIAGLVLFVSQFMWWYEENQSAATAWQSFTLIDVLIGLTSLLAMVLPFITYLRGETSGPQKFTLIVVALDVLVILCIVVRLFNVPEFNGLSLPVQLKPGIFVGLAAAVCLLLFTVMAVAHRRAGRAPSRAGVAAQS